MGAPSLSKSHDSRGKLAKLTATISAVSLALVILELIIFEYGWFNSASLWPVIDACSLPANTNHISITYICLPKQGR